MQQLAVEQRRLLGDRAPWHVGDVAWGLRQHEGREREWSIRTWVEDGRVVAWSWLKGDRAIVELDVHPDHYGLLDEMLMEPEAQTAVAVEALVVGPAVGEDPRHRPQLARIHRRAARPEDSGDAAHARHCRGRLPGASRRTRLI